MITGDIRSDRLVLSSLRADQVDDGYEAWMNDPLVLRYLEARAESHTHDSLLSYVEAMRSSDTSWLFGIFLRQGGDHIGNAKLGPFSRLHNTATLGLVLGRRDHWGRGYATEAIRAVVSWAFDELELDKVTAGAYAANTGSVRAFQRAGFAIEGIQRQQARLDDGTRDDVVIMGRLKTDDGISTL